MAETSPFQVFTGATFAMKHAFLVGAFSCLIGAGCGSSTTPEKDSQVSASDQSPVVDQIIAVAEQSITQDQGVITANSGIICENKSVCDPNDECISPPGSFQRMCLSYCTPGDSCPVPNIAKNASQCSISVGTDYFCIWFCHYKSKDYECPDAVNYDCITPNMQQPDTKICVPKK